MRVRVLPMPWLDIWTVYDHPLDYPHGYIARRWRVRAPAYRGEYVPPMTTSDVVTGATLDEVRRQLPAGLQRQPPRDPADVPVIVEIWF